MVIQTRGRVHGQMIAHHVMRTHQVRIHRRQHQAAATITQEVLHRQVVTLDTTRTWKVTLPINNRELTKKTISDMPDIAQTDNPALIRATNCSHES